jgi:predicted transcriptional regulator
VKPSQAVTTDSLMTPSAVASAFRVDPKTVTRWAKAGKLSSIRTAEGHRRYLESEVRAILSVASGAEEWHEPAHPERQESSTEAQPAAGLGSAVS